MAKPLTVTQATTQLHTYEYRSKTFARRISELEARLADQDAIRADRAEQAKIGATRAQRENPDLMAHRIDTAVASTVADIERSLATARLARDDETAKAEECRKIIADLA